MTGLSEKQIDFTDAVPGITEVVDYWWSKRGDQDFPRKSSIEPWELQEQLGRICLLEIQDDPLDFIYRLDGSNIASALSCDMTGRPVSEVEPSHYADAVHAALAKTLSGAEPTLWDVSIDFPPAVYSYQRVVLPLANGDDEIRFLMTYCHCLNSADGKFPWNRSYGKPS